MIVYALLGLLAALGAAGLWRHRVSRYNRLLCPYRLSWLADNPLMDRVTGVQTTLGRIGLRPGERGLDVGSGWGRLSLPAARRVGPTGQIVALDIQPEMAARLRRRAARAGIANAIVCRGDIAIGPCFSPDSFDRAWMVTVLGEVPDQLAALHNVYRVLKPGGTLSITELFFDPHYQNRAAVLRLGREAGFEPSRRWGTALAYTQNFVKPTFA